MTSWLHERRLEAVLAALRDSGAESVADLGCGDGALLIRLAREPAIRRVVGIDVSADALERLRVLLRREPADLQDKIDLVHGSMLDPNNVPDGIGAAVLVEAIEHIEPDRLSLVERAIFGELGPATVIITTPNGDFNALLGVPRHRRRHPDHRFEWSRARFRAWAEGVGARNGYAVSCRDVAGAHPLYGGPSQMALFQRHADRRSRQLGAAADGRSPAISRAPRLEA